MKLNLPLLALAVGAFGIGTTEFAPMGLLPVIAADLKVSIPSAGLLVTAYAVGVMVGAPVVTLATGRIQRKSLLIGLMALFTIGNLLSALSPSYDMLLMARLVTSMTHGAFFGIGSVVAAGLVSPDKRSSAVATMFMGLTIANIAGVPLATFVGQHIGWRSAFGGIAVLGGIAMTALWLALPKGAPMVPTDVRREVGVLGQPVVIRALATTVLSAGAMFTLLTYLAPILLAETRATPGFVTIALVIVGLGFTVGNYAGGRLADRSVDGTLIGFLIALAVLMLAFTLTMHGQIPALVTIFLWATASFAVVPPLQTRVMVAAKDAPNLASAVNIGAFNLGNAIGAAVGAAVIAAGLGYVWVPVAGAVISLGGLAMVVLGAMLGQPKPARVAANAR